MHDRMFRAADAHKLDDPQRKVWLPPEQVLGALDLRPGMVIADIGAGSGYFTFPIAESAVNIRKVYAVDVQPQMLAILKSRIPASQTEKISPVEGRADATSIPSVSCDLALLANLWHEIDDRSAALRECRRILRRTGRVAILDWRADLPSPPGPPVEHRISDEAAAAELTRDGWKVTYRGNLGAYSYLLIASADGGSSRPEDLPSASGQHTREER
jgi:ubiquinone/menaquinone biosynthesis C-methylase UbiE